MKPSTAIMAFILNVSLIAHLQAAPQSPNPPAQPNPVQDQNDAKTVLPAKGSMCTNVVLGASSYNASIGHFSWSQNSSEETAGDGRPGHDPLYQTPRIEIDSLLPSLAPLRGSFTISKPTNVSCEAILPSVRLKTTIPGNDHTGVAWTHLESVSIQDIDPITRSVCEIRYSINSGAIDDMIRRLPLYTSGELRQNPGDPHYVAVIMSAQLEPTSSSETCIQWTQKYYVQIASGRQNSFTSDRRAWNSDF